MGYKQIEVSWQENGEKDFEVAQGLFRLNHYSHCLFFCHLALEKFLKAIFVHRKQRHAPYIHDLLVLAKRVGIELSQKQISELETITSFNIQARYADYKSEFYKRFNRKVYAAKYLSVTKDSIKWLKEELTKK